MRKRNAKEAPLSSWAQDKINGKWFDCFGWTAILSAITGFVWVVVCILNLIAGFLGPHQKMSGSPLTPKEFFFWMFVFVLADCLVFLVNYLLLGRSYNKRKSQILSENEADHQQSLRLKSALENVCSIVASDLPVLEEGVVGTWRPFRVEHFLSESMRSEIHGQTKLNLFSLRLSVRGHSRSVVTPNLLDTSSVIFLQNDEGKTLRALIPSPRTTKEMIAGAMQKWFSDIPGNTHTHAVLEECSFREENIATPISHPELIDSLDASCELKFPDRPEVSVIGQEIQKGVVIASALKVGGKTSIFLPTGFFKQLADDISSAVQNVLPAPTAIEAIDTA